VRTVKKFSPTPPGSYECQQAAASPAPGDPVVACDTTRTESYTLGPEAVVLHPTHAESHQNATGYGVVVTLDQPSQAAFASYTSANLGTQAALVLSGAVIGSPEIRVPVNSNQLEISTYGETAQQADAIVKSLQS
jgi:preprotein translocase subunit SecD